MRGGEGKRDEGRRGEERERVKRGEGGKGVEGRRGEKR